MKFIVLNLRTGQYLVKPTAIGQTVHWCYAHACDPWQFETREGAQRARDMHAAGEKRAVVVPLPDWLRVARPLHGPYSSSAMCGAQCTA